MALWLRGKRATHGVVWLPYTGSHGVVCFFSLLLHCIALHRVYMGCLIEEGGSLPFQILRSLSHRLWNIERPKSKSERSLVWTRYLEQDFGCPAPDLDSMAAWFCIFWDQRFVTIFVILRCHRLLCEDVAQIKEVSPGWEATHVFLCKLSHLLLKMKTNVFTKGLVGLTC